MRRVSGFPKKRNPIKTALNKARKEWRQVALDRANHRCEWCGVGGKGLNVHHIIGQRYKPLRLHNLNSVVLCARCHKFGIGIAAHENPIRVVDWLAETRPLALQILRAHIKEMLK